MYHMQVVGGFCCCSYGMTRAAVPMTRSVFIPVDPELKVSRQIRYPELKLTR